MQHPENGTVIHKNVTLKWLSECMRGNSTVSDDKVQWQVATFRGAPPEAGAALATVTASHPDTQAVDELRVAFARRQLLLGAVGQ